MPNTRIALLLALCPVATAQVGTEPPQQPHPTYQLTPEEVAQGWHVLFDGTSTDAWRGYKAEGFPQQGWSIAGDGSLHHAAGGGGGDIITRRQYRNFELAFDWRISRSGNSGVMYRVAETDHPSYWTGPEYQVLDPGVDTEPVHQAGALYALYPPLDAKPRPAGEWNAARIVIIGDQVEHWLNGAKVAAARFGSEDWKSRVANSKFADWSGFGEHERGHICLQDHGDAVWYRNIKCREIAPTEARLGTPVKLFDGTAESLANWSAHLRADDAELADVWSVQDGVLVCKGQPIGYLYTKDTFEDFVLRVVWRFDPEKGAGNSGVLLRMSGEHTVWPRSIEAQLHSGNAGDFWNIGDYPMHVVRERTNGRNTKKTHGNEKPLGEWNEYQIICDDGWVSLRVNGQVLNEAWGCEDIAGPICLQSEGAEIHFREVTLTPLKPTNE